MTNDKCNMENGKYDCLLSCQGRDPILVDHPDRDLRQLPHLVPLDFVILAVDQLLDQQVAELTALALEHELFGVRLGDVEEAEVRVERQADAFERHDRAHHIGEIRRDRERVFVDHVGQLVGQFPEADFAQLQVQVIREELFDHEAYGVPVHIFRQEVEVDHVLSQPLHVAFDDVEEGVDHQTLHPRRDAPDHPEIEEGQPPVIHHSQVPRMRIGMEEAVFEKLFEVSPRNQLDHFRRVDAALGQCFQVQNFGPLYELHRQHARADVRPVDHRHVNLAPAFEMVAEGLGVAALLDIIHLLEDRRREFIQRPFPIDSAYEFREAAHKTRDAAQHGQVKVDYVFEVRALNFDRHGLARMQSSAIDLP